MNLDCYEFCLWTLGKLTLDQTQLKTLNHPFKGEENDEL